MSSVLGNEAQAAVRDFQAMREAADWFAVLRSGGVTDDERRDWRLWLEASAEHRHIWQRVEAISGCFELAEEERGTAEAVLATSSRQRDRRRALKMLSLLCIGGSGALALGQIPQLRQPLTALAADHATGTGETRQLVLADGSSLWLNTGTAINVRYTAGLRRIELLHGELLVETAPDTQPQPRPLVVDSQQGRMRALGTRFTVRQFDEATRLDVYEGRVEVVPRAAAEASRIVPTGAQVAFSDVRIDAEAAADPAHKLWSRGLLMADDMPLGELITELARYRRGYLGCAPQVARLRVVGGYPLHDTDLALGMLEAALPVRIRQRMPWWVTVEAL